MKASVFFLILTITLCFDTSCKKKDYYVKMNYYENLCANPWNQEFDNSVPDYQNKVKDYLENYGINIKSISIDGQIGACLGCKCFSCICLTGRRISILIFENDIYLAEGLGFIRE
jgi:hypothetical protein